MERSVRGPACGGLGGRRTFGATRIESRGPRSNSSPPPAGEQIPNIQRTLGVLGAWDWRPRAIQAILGTHIYPPCDPEQINPRAPPRVAPRPRSRPLRRPRQRGRSVPARPSPSGVAPRSSGWRQQQACSATTRPWCVAPYAGNSPEQDDWEPPCYAVPPEATTPECGATLARSSSFKESTRSSVDCIDSQPAV